MRAAITLSALELAFIPLKMPPLSTGKPADF